MRVVIVGASKIGTDFVKWFCEEGFDVVVVDKDLEKLDEITEMYDCNRCAGNASSRAFLQSIGIESVGLLIATTKEDEANILCCYVAKQLGVKRVLATVRGPEYTDDIDYIKGTLGIDMVLNPDREAAAAIVKLVKYACSIEIENFEEVGASIASYRVTSDSKMVGLNPQKTEELWGDKVKICSVERDGKIIRFDSGYAAKEGDFLVFSTATEDLSDVLKKVDIEERTGKTVIVGGGKIGYFILKMLVNMGRKVTLVENDLKRCVELINEFSNVNIVMGDGTDADFMAKRLQGADACVAVTGSDDKNLVISMFAKSFGVDRIAAEIQNDDYEMVMKKSGIAHAFSKQDMVMSGVIRKARSIGSKTIGTKDEIRYSQILERGKIEAHEFLVGEDFPMCNVPILSEAFKVKPQITIGTIYRDGKLIVPTNQDEVLKAKDRIVIIASECRISKLSDILA